MDITNYRISNSWKSWLEKINLSDEDSRNTVPLITEAKVSLFEDKDIDRISEILVTANLATIDAGIAEEILESKRSPVIDGRPRMLHISGFIAHEGVNRNRNGFVAEELKEIVESKKLFQGSYAGMLDYNHNLDPIGYWYDSEFMYDSAAQSFGILAHGAIWAWRFSELSDSLIAEQQRSGNVKLSMACLTNSREMKPGSDGKTVEWLHNPIFVATTVLIDAEPGDPHGRSIIQEDPKNSGEEDRKQKVLETASSKDETLENVIMDAKEIREALNAVLEGTEESVLAKVAQLFDDRIAQILSQRADELMVAKAAIDTLNIRVAELEGEVEDKSVAMTTLKEEKESLEVKAAQLEQDLSTYRNKEELDRIEAVKTARLGELSEPARHALQQMSVEKRDSVLSRWAELSDELWAERKEELNLAGTKSTEPIHGRLPVGAPSGNTIDRFIRKVN